MKLRFINPKHYLNEFKQLFKFVITPVYNSNNTLTISQKIEGTWRMFIVKFALAILVGVSIGIFYEAENLTTSNMAERFPSPAVLFLVMIIMSTLEEVAFRLSLKFKPLYFGLTFGVLGYYMVTKGVYQTKLSDVNDHFLERVIIAFIIIIATYAIAVVPKVKIKLEVFWKKHFRWILYILCFGFAWSHIFNYELTLFHLLLIPIITLDKLISAFCFGYVRVHYGFLYAVSLHICWNTMGFIVNLISGTGAN